MARSEKGRARQQARRNAYADVVLPRIASRAAGYDLKSMVWGNELAQALPEGTSMGARRKLARLISVAMTLEGEKQEHALAEAQAYLNVLAGRHEHLSQAAKLLAFPAGKTATPGLRTRIDPGDAHGNPTITPSWGKK